MTMKIILDLKNIINSSSIQISTLKDKAYIIDYIDGDFCAIKMGYKIEIVFKIYKSNKI